MAENGEIHEPCSKIAELSEEAPPSLTFFKVKKLSSNAILASRGSSLSGGYDLYSAAEVKVPARGKALIPTDLSIAIPADTYARIDSRSELSWEHSIGVGAGVVDADYRGPVGVILYNHSYLDFMVKPGDCIAQLIIPEIITPDAVETEDLSSTILGAGEFGSTGLLSFFKVKKRSSNAILPSRGSSLSAGYDLSSAAEVKVPARGRALIPTDLSISIPINTYARIAPRSGLAWKHSIDVGKGVIDASYRGSVDVILVNHSDLDFVVKPGDRIAQLIIEKILTPDVGTEDLNSTIRGAGGFGSTELPNPSSLPVQSSAMAENDEIQEPCSKIAKLSEKAPLSLTFLKVKKLSSNAILPSRASSLSAGYDLSSAAEVKVPARGKALIPTDLSIAIPKNSYARIASRSELVWKHSIDVGAGVIYADYRGPVGVILFNHSDLDFFVKPGNLIAQLIIQKIITPDIVETEDLDSTIRGAGGFGSTGVNKKKRRRGNHTGQTRVVESPGSKRAPKAFAKRCLYASNVVLL